MSNDKEPTSRLSSVRSTATPASTFPTVNEISIIVPEEAFRLGEASVVGGKVGIHDRYKVTLLYFTSVRTLRKKPTLFCAESSLLK